MAKTPDQVDLRIHERTGRYYDGGRYRDDDAVDQALAAGTTRWWICYFSESPDRREFDAEEDAVAPSKGEASAVMRAALARDFDEGCTLRKVALA